MIRTESIRYRLLRNGLDYGEIYADGAPTLRMDGNGEIKMSMQGNFLPIAVDSRGNSTEVDWLADEVKPILNINGEDFPLAVLMPAKVVPSKDKNKETLNVQFYDRCWRVRDMKVEGSLHLTAGTMYLDAVEQLLTSSGIGTIIKTPSTATLTEDREDWQTGVSYLTIVNQLLSEINYKQLWFNASGFAMLEPVSTPTAVNIQHTFTGNKPDQRLQKEIEAIRVHPKITREMDIYQAPNVFVCICSNADKDAGLVAKAVNTNPQSPLSTMRRGRRIVQVVNVDNIASQAELQAYANKLLNESMITGETIRVETALQPGFGVEDVTAINYEDVFGICLEKQWEMQLQAGGTMTHTLEKVVINLG